MVSYNGISSKAKESALKSTLEQSSKKLEIYKLQDSTQSYPSGSTGYTSAGLSEPNNITYDYTQSGTGTNSTYCLQASYNNTDLTYYVSNTSPNPTEGECPAPLAQTGDDIQTVTPSNCPTTRTMVVDARDDHTYWIQKLADDNCWMLTNLAYAGGGTNTYGDVKTLQEWAGNSYTAPYYSIDSTNSNPTTYPTEPSTSTDGGSTGKQYGYYYNWCAAMGAQTGTDACDSTQNNDYDTDISICPAGWRLPTGGSSGELKALNDAINSGSTSSPSGLLTTWLAQYGGNRGSSSFSSQGTYGLYWSASQGSSSYAYYLYFSSSYVYPALNNSKGSGQSVRCVADSVSP